MARTARSDRRHRHTSCPRKRETGLAIDVVDLKNKPWCDHLIFELQTSRLDRMDPVLTGESVHGFQVVYANLDTLRLEKFRQGLFVGGTLVVHCSP